MANGTMIANGAMVANGAGFVLSVPSLESQINQLVFKDLAPQWLLGDGLKSLIMMVKRVGIMSSADWLCGRKEAPY